MSGALVEVNVLEITDEIRVEIDELVAGRIVEDEDEVLVVVVVTVVGSGHLLFHTSLFQINKS
jgi:hypothetical protein